MKFMAVMGMIYGMLTYAIALIPVIVEVSSTRDYVFDRYAGWVIFLLSAILWKVSSKKRNSSTSDNDKE
jgi:amino acid permease